MAIEIVDLPSFKMVMFHRCVGLPEGILANMECFLLGERPGTSAVPSASRLQMGFVLIG